MVKLKEERERLKAAREDSYRQSYSAAWHVGKELKSMLRMAASRGLTIDQMFEHFDDKGLGYVDADDLVEGLAKLGLGVTTAAAEILMSMIGRTSTFLFRKDDLEAYGTAPDPPAM